MKQTECKAAAGNPPTDASTLVLPFGVDRHSDLSLIDQVVDGFRRAIVGGLYPIDSTLPNLVEIASGLGVSMNVVRIAIDRLSKEGLLIARRRVGIVVKPNGTKLYLGRILLIKPNGDDGYFYNVLVGAVKASLFKWGYYVTEITAFRSPGGGFDLSRLEIELREQHDLVILISDNAAVKAVLGRSSAPFVVVGRESMKVDAQNCVGNVREDFDAGMNDVAAQCMRTGIRRVLVVHAWRRRAATFAALRTVGVDAEDWHILPKSRYGRIEGVQRAGMEAFASRLERDGRGWLPDLLLFPDDDILAAGCLTALACAGVRIPEDIRVVTLSNKGLGPVYPRTLARLEVDPASYGERVAHYAREILSKRTLPPNIRLCSAYVPGESFPDAL